MLKINFILSLIVVSHSIRAEEAIGGNINTSNSQRCLVEEMSVNELARVYRMSSSQNDLVDGIFSIGCKRGYRFDLIVSDYMDQVEWLLEENIKNGKDPIFKEVREVLARISQDTPLGHFTQWDLELSRYSERDPKIQELLNSVSIQLYDEQGYALKTEETMFINGASHLAITPSLISKNLVSFKDAIAQFDFQDIVQKDVKYLKTAKYWMWGHVDEINESIERLLKNIEWHSKFGPDFPLNPPFPTEEPISDQEKKHVGELILKYFFNLFYGYLELQDDLDHFKHMDDKKRGIYLDNILRFLYGHRKEVNHILQTAQFPIEFKVSDEPRSADDFKKFRETLIPSLHVLKQTYPDRPWVDSKKVILHRQNGNPIYLVGFPLKTLYVLGDYLEEQIQLENILPNTIAIGVGIGTGNPLVTVITPNILKNIIQVSQGTNSIDQALISWGYNTALDVILCLGFGGVPLQFGTHAFKGAVSGAAQAITVQQPLGPAIFTGALVESLLYYAPTAKLTNWTVGSNPSSLAVNALIETSQAGTKWFLRSYLIDIVAELTDQSNPADQRSPLTKAYFSALSGAGVTSAIILFTGPRTSPKTEISDPLRTYLRQNYNHRQNNTGVTYRFDTRDLDRFSYRDGRSSVVGVIIGKDGRNFFSGEGGVAVNDRGLKTQIFSHEFHHAEQFDTREIGPIPFFIRYLQQLSLPHNLRPFESKVLVPAAHLR